MKAAGNVCGRCHFVDQLATDTHPTRQVPQPGGEFAGVIVAGVQHPDVVEHLGRQVGIEVVGP